MFWTLLICVSFYNFRTAIALPSLSCGSVLHWIIQGLEFVLLVGRKIGRRLDIVIQSTRDSKELGRENEGSSVLGSLSGGKGGGEGKGSVRS